MKNFLLPILAASICLTLLLSACGSTPTPQPTTAVVSTATPIPTFTSTMTPDPCAAGSVEKSVDKVHSHMREFDDASALAANLPREQLSGPIANLQKIRRDAEDEQIPACLTNLKDHQIQHMNSVIGTLIAFMGGANQQDLDKGISIAREQHDQYTLELARILGLTIVPATAAVIPSETPTP
jgi:hypothetical protein